MKKFPYFSVTLILVLLICAPAYATYSVVGVNTRTGEVGIAGAS